MTADEDKSPGGRNTTVCLICNASVNVSTRNTCHIFNQTGTASNRPIAEIISSVLGVQLQEGLVHSPIVCRKCFKACNEVDELQERLTELKIEINGNYHRSVKKFDTEELEDKPDIDADNNCHEVNKEEPQVKVNNSKPLNNTKIIVAKKQLSQTIKDDTRDIINNSLSLSEHKENNDNNIMEVDEIVEDIGDPNDSDYVPENEKSKDGCNKLPIKIEANDESDSSLMGNRKGRRKKPQQPVKNELASMIPQMVVSRDSSVYTCLLCPADDKVMSDPKGITAHMKDVHQLRLYICDICGQEFLKRTDLSSHLDEHVANEEGDFQCEVCNRIFSNLRLYRVHKRMHVTQIKNWTCDQCGKRYLSRNTLEEHMNSHTGVRPYRCKICGKDFASKYTFRSHEKTHTERPRPFSCTQCTKTFVTKQNLIQHERTHSSLKNYVCTDCGKRFGTARNLEVHCLVHSGYKPFVCRMCGKAFARKAEIRDHERTHTGEKPYQCEFCGATFSQRSNLQSHKRATHYDDKRYKCLDCGKGFKRRRLLDYHMKAAHTGERPYKCQICSATFIYPEHFKKHRRIHTGEKPYQCEVCGKAFNSRDNRNAHRFVHSDKKPYECLVCGMGFMRKPLLYNHMQTQGHLNDTIVVNQPRLTTDDSDLMPPPTEMTEMTLITDSEGNHKLLPADQVDLDGTAGDTKMFIAELKEHVIIQQRKDQIDKPAVVSDEIAEGVEYEDTVEHLIIDGQVHFTNPSAMEALEGGAEVSSVAEITTSLDDRQHTLVVPASRHHGAYAVGEPQTTMVQTDEGPVHLVHIRIPGEGDSNQWYNIVQQ